MPVDVNDAEVSEALLSLEMKSDGSVNESFKVVDEKTLPPVVHEGGREQVQVVLPGEGTICNDGIVRIPLEIKVNGSTCRFVVSIAIDHDVAESQ
jgi:hypothetical protein